MQPLIVTAAIIEHQGKILITQRLPEARHAGLWEFPGGKLDPDETPQAGLQRELREELGIDAVIGPVYDVIYYRYDWGPVLILAYRCRPGHGIVRNLGVADHRWVAPGELAGYPFLAADIPLIERLRGAACESDA